MEKLLKYFLSGLVCIAIGACSKEHVPYFKKQIDETRHENLAIKLKEGIHHYYQGTVAQQLLLQEALKYDTTNGDIYRELGVPYLKRGLASGYYELYQKAVGKHPVIWTGWRGYIYLFFYRDYERALADFDAMDTLTPDVIDYPQSLSVDYLRGICCLQMGQFDRALSFFDKHLVYEVQFSGEEYIMPQAYLYKGITQFKMGAFNQAMETFEKGLDLSPVNADLLFWKAKCLLQTGNHTEAMTHLILAETSIKQGHRNTRPYVEEFYAVYLSNVKQLQQSMK